MSTIKKEIPDKPPIEFVVRGRIRSISGKLLHEYTIRIFTCRMTSCAEEVALSQWVNYGYMFYPTGAEFECEVISRDDGIAIHSTDIKDVLEGKYNYGE